MTSTEPVEFTNPPAEVPLIPLPRTPLADLVGSCLYPRILLLKETLPDGPAELRWSDPTEAENDVEEPSEWEIVHIAQCEVTDDQDEAFFALLTEYGKPLDLAEALELWELLGDWAGYGAVMQALIAGGYGDLSDLSDLKDAATNRSHGVWRNRQEFAENYAEDMGATGSSVSWPYTHIDWEAAADDLFMDGGYTAYEYEGSLYVFSDY